MGVNVHVCECVWVLQIGVGASSSLRSDDEIILHYTGCAHISCNERAS